MSLVRSCHRDIQSQHRHHPNGGKEEISRGECGRWIPWIILTEGLKHDFIFASISLGLGGRIRTQTVTLLSPEEAFKSVFLFLE